MHVSMDHVAIRHGDTHGDPAGRRHLRQPEHGHGRRRHGVGAERVIQKARRIAAHLLEAAPEDMVQADGGFAVAGVPDKNIHLAPDCRRRLWRKSSTRYGARPAGDGILRSASARPGALAHMWRMVRIDRETGKPTIEKLVLVDDCGVIVNPMIVEGQVHGGRGARARRSVAANRCSSAMTAKRSPAR